MSTLVVGNLSITAGQKLMGWVHVVNSGHKLPVTLINGAKAGKTVTIMAGTHGSEYVGVEAINRLAHRLDPQIVSGKLILVHLVNSDAFYGKIQYVNPTDGKNMGGVYPGDANGSISEKIAFTITEEMIKQSDFIFDLHSGDVHEDLDSFGWVDSTDATRELSLKAARLMNTRFVAFSHDQGGALGTAARLGIPGIAPEVGGNGKCEERYVDMDVQGVTNVLKMLGVLEGEPVGTRGVEVGRVTAVRAERRGCFYPYVDLDQPVKQGDVIGVTKDFFGNLLTKHVVPEDGEVFCVARSLAVRPNDIIFGIRHRCEYAENSEAGNEA